MGVLGGGVGDICCSVIRGHGLPVEHVELLVHGNVVEPAEDQALPVLRAARLRPDLAVVGKLHGEAGVADAAVVDHLEGLGLTQVEHDALARLAGGPAGLGRIGHAQVCKGNHGVDERHGEHQDAVDAPEVQAVVLPLRRIVADPLRRRSLAADALHQAALAIRIRRGQRAHAMEGADVQAHPAQVQGVEYVDQRQQRIQPLLRGLQVPVVARTHAALEHQQLVHGRGAGRHGEGCQQALVAVKGVGQRQQQQRRVDIALVDHRAEGADQHDQQAAREQQVVGLLRFQIQEARVDVGRAEQDPGKHRPADLGGGCRPVEAQQRIQVQRVDRQVGIAAQGAAVQLVQPGHRAHEGVGHAGRTADAEHEGRAIEQRQRGDQTGDEAADAGLVGLAHQIDHDGEQAQRRKEHRLGLDEHGSRKGQQGGEILLIRRLQRAQHHQQREHRVDLSPRGGIDQHRRIEGVEQRNRRTKVGMQPLALRHAPDQQRAQQVAEDGKQLQKRQMRAALHRQIHQVAQRSHRPQKQHISRRIVAEVVRGVEVGDSVCIDALRPAGEAVDVGVVAAHRDRQHQAHDQRDGQADPQRKPGMPFASAIQRPGRVALQTVAAARQRQNQHRIQRGQQQIGLGVALGHLIVRLCICGRAAGGLVLLQGEDLHILGPFVQLHDLHIVEVRAAGVESTVAAHAQHQRDLGLILAGLAADGDLPPLTCGVRHRFGVDEGVPEGQRGTVVAVAAVLGAHHAAEAVVAVRLHGDGLDKARVVFVGVDHHGAVAVVAVLRHVQPAHACVGVPHVPLPAVGHAGRIDLGKIAVDGQVSGLGKRR